MSPLRPPALSRRCIGCVLALAAACAANPDSRKQAYFTSGNRYLASSRFEEAIIQYRNAIEIDPKFAPARVKLGEAYLRAGDPAKALAQYVRAADLLPADVSVQLKAGGLLLAARRYDEARARADSVLERDPRSAGAHILRGNAVASLRDFEGGVAEIEEALRLDPAKSVAYASLGGMQLARGRRQEAEDAFKKALALAPQSIEAHLAVANFYWNIERPDDARRTLEAALKLQPDHVLVNRGLAALAISSGHPEDAEQYLRRTASPTSPESVLALADYYLAMKRPRDAVDRLGTLRPDRRVKAAVDERLVRAYVMNGETGRAHALADEMIKRNPKDATARLVKGELLFGEGRREEALDAVRAAVAANPKDASAQFLLGKVYAARGDIPAAQAAFTEVLKDNPRAASAQVELAKLHLASRQSDASVTAAQEALASAPQSVEARVVLIRGLLAKPDLRGAEREIDELARLYPGSAIVEVQRGLLLTARRQSKEARAAFIRALELAPGSFDALGGLTYLDLAAGDVAGARARLDGIIARGKASPAVLMLAARTCLAGRDVRSAEALLRRAIDAEPTLLTAYALLGQVYLLQNRLDDARREYTALAARQTNPVVPLTMIGLILQLQGDLSGAERQFEKVLSIDPDAAVAANNLAWLYASRGANLDIALQLARTARAALPDVPQVADTLGWVLVKRNLPDLAVEPLLDAAGREPRNAVFQYHLGTAYLKAGDTTRGRAALEHALVLDATFDGAEDARQTLRELPGQSKR